MLIIVELTRRGISMQHVGRIVREHRKRHDNPLNELRFDVIKGRLYILHPDGAWDERGQGVFEQILRLEPIRVRIRDAVRQGRPESKHGKVERVRKVLGSASVFAGTRIPVATVIEYLEAGISHREILKAFPRLTPRDLQVAQQAAAS